MRILSFVMLAAAFANNACYSPSIADCKLTCADDTACPSDQTCSNGICRDKNATGTCPGETFDSGTHDSTTVDTRPPNTACDPAPDGCTIISTAGEPCVAHCTTSLNYSNAKAACAAKPTWQLAAFITGIPGNGELPQGEHWIGLSRAGVTGPWSWLGSDATVDPSDPRWSTDVGHTGKATLSDAALRAGSLYSDLGTQENPYLCTKIIGDEPAD